jgi:hypothetical protein
MEHFGLGIQVGYPAWIVGSAITVSVPNDPIQKIKDCTSPFRNLTRYFEIEVIHSQIFSADKNSLIIDNSSFLLYFLVSVMFIRRHLVSDKPSHSL